MKGSIFSFFSKFLSTVSVYCYFFPAALQPFVHVHDARVNQALGRFAHELRGHRHEFHGHELHRKGSYQGVCYFYELTSVLNIPTWLGFILSSVSSALLDGSLYPLARSLFVHGSTLSARCWFSPHSPPRLHC